MIKTDIFLPIGYTSADIENKICEKLPVRRSEIKSTVIISKELRLDGDIGYKLSVGVAFCEEREAGLLKMKKKVFAMPELSLTVREADKRISPVVVGAGPAGLFCALVLAEAGLKPLVIERGESVEKREQTVKRFFTDANLNTESNVQFGEGGAGAFSDGKLKYGLINKYKYKVLKEFVHAGASEDILWTKGAHLGTDKLPSIVHHIREKIIALGGSFSFNTKLSDVLIKGGKVYAVKVEREGRTEEIETDAVFLAIGHSARDTIEMLYSKGLSMEAKGFGIGMRIEHPREYINSLIYKDKVSESEVGAASYHLVSHLPSGRSVYSFCMCPGGTVVAASGEAGGICTNGMSEYKRDADNSNSALLVSVSPSDFGSEHPLAGIRLQREIERAAYRTSGNSYAAPAIRLSEFLSGGVSSELGSVRPSYPIGTVAARPENYLPSYITDSLKEGIASFDDWLGGFAYPDAVLTGAEARSTSPVRILRREDFSALGTEGLYPIGEGGGYAGGIVSAATDGLCAALTVMGQNE
ncbi:MAG: FAD-binding protein [Clostridia bacterium]|nr:FAD-binding protein [Clostridia bacterium]